MSKVPAKTKFFAVAEEVLLDARFPSFFPAGQAGVSGDPGALDHAAAAAAAAQEAAEGRAGPAAEVPGAANGAGGGEEHAAPAGAAWNGVQTTLQLSEKEQVRDREEMRGDGVLCAGVGR